MDILHGPGYIGYYTMYAFSEMDIALIYICMGIDITDTISVI